VYKSKTKQPTFEELRRIRLEKQNRSVGPPRQGEDKRLAGKHTNCITTVAGTSKTLANANGAIDAEIFTKRNMNPQHHEHAMSLKMAEHANGETSAETSTKTRARQQQQHRVAMRLGQKHHQEQRCPG
jgi:hypothetical protein